MDTGDYDAEVSVELPVSIARVITRHVDHPTVQSICESLKDDAPALSAALEALAVELEGAASEVERAEAKRANAKPLSRGVPVPVAPSGQPQLLFAALTTEEKKPSLLIVLIEDVLCLRGPAIFATSTARRAEKLTELLSEKHPARYVTVKGNSPNDVEAAAVVMKQFSGYDSGMPIGAVCCSRSLSGLLALAIGTVRSIVVYDTPESDAVINDITGVVSAKENWCMAVALVTNSREKKSVMRNGLWDFRRPL
jgi:hypothetical protein